MFSTFFTPSNLMSSALMTATGLVPSTVGEGMREPVISSFSTFSVAVCAKAKGAAISEIAISVAMTHVFLLKDLACCLFLLINGSSIDFGLCETSDPNSVDPGPTAPRRESRFMSRHRPENHRVTPGKQIPFLIKALDCKKPVEGGSGRD